MPHYTRRTPLFAALLCIACSQSPTLPEDGGIAQFVAGGDLPNAQPPRVLLHLPAYRAKLFLASYGAETGCMPSTDPYRGPCYASSAIGFEYRGRIGWLQTQPDTGEPPAQFVFHAKDDELYGPAIATAWQDAEWGSYATIFTPALLRAPSTPRATLLRLAEELGDWISPHNAHLLLARAEVRIDAEILTIVAGLLVAQGDPYAQTRQVAQGLLDSLATH